MQALSQCHAWTGTVCRKHIYCSFVPHYLQGFKPLLQGKIVSFPINMAGYSWKLKQKRLCLMKLPWVLHFSGVLRPKSILTKTLDSSVEFKIQTLCSSSANEWCSSPSLLRNTFFRSLSTTFGVTNPIPQFENPSPTGILAGKQECAFEETLLSIPHDIILLFSAGQSQSTDCAHLVWN